MFKVILDSNVIISGLLFGGKPKIIFDAVLKGKLKLGVSNEIIREIYDVLKRPKFKLNEFFIKTFIIELENISEIVCPVKKLKIIKKDEDDNKILECADEFKADYIITGDCHLLEIKKYKKINIITADEFLNIYNEN